MILIPDRIKEICPSHSGYWKNVLYRKREHHHETVNFSNKISSIHKNLPDITGEGANDQKPSGEKTDNRERPADN